MPNLSRDKNPDGFRFMDKARQLVFERVLERLKNNESDYKFTLEDVAVYWFSKTATGWDVRLNTTLPDSILYRLVHDTVTKTTSFEVYHKFDTQTFVDEDNY